MAKRSKIAIAWGFMTKSLLKLSFLILYLLCFVTVQASSSTLFYCQIGQSSKKLPEDKFRFQIKGNEIHFLPLGFFNPRIEETQRQEMDFIAFDLESEFIFR